MNRLVLLLPIMLTVSSAATLAHGLTPAQGNKVMIQRIQQLQQRVERALFEKSGIEAYGLHKAEAWLDFALHEAIEDDRTGVIEDAITEAEKSLAAKSPVQADPPLIRGSEKARPDLWKRATVIRQSQDFQCAYKESARLDVMLIWFGHEKWESGWTHARPFVEQAENLAYEAETAIRLCEQQRLASRATSPSASTSPPVTIERFTFATDTLFKFNKDGVEHLVDGGQRKLTALINSLKTWKSIDKIEVIGHTDRLGSDRYNNALSMRRASHVRDFLANGGLARERMNATSRGEQEPIVQCSGTRKTPALIQCLQPNRRVELVVQGSR